MKNKYIFITPIANLYFDPKVCKQLIVDGVIFLRRERLPYIRKSLGLKEPFSSIQWPKGMKSDYLKKADVYAVIKYTGDSKNSESIHIKRVQDALHIIMVSELGYSKRRIASIPVLWGSQSVNKYEYFFINTEKPNLSLGWRLIGTTQQLRFDGRWKKFNSSQFFFKLVNIVNKKCKIDRSWRDLLTKAAILIGKSFSSKDVGQAFLLNMIVIEMLLTEQGDKYSNIILERIESFIGLTGYWDLDDYSEKIKTIYKKRCAVVHDGNFECINIEDLLFSDDIIFNIMNNIVNHLSIFKSKKDVIEFGKKIIAENILGINAKVRPKTLSFLHKTYTGKDLIEII